MTGLGSPTPDHDRASPLFRSATECRNWLVGLALTNAPQVQLQLTRELDLFSRMSLPAGERLQILELIRGPLTSVQQECARRFVGKPLPLSPTERLAYDACQTLWNLLTINYLHCLHAALDGDPVITRSTAQVAQRALASTRAALLDHCRAGIVPPPSLWRRLHQIYGTAEALQAVQQVVQDHQACDERTSVTATYAESLLLFAARPYTLSQKQLTLVAYWARRWAPKIRIEAVRPNEAKTPPMIVDLTGEHPATFDPGDAAGPECRWLGLDALRRSLRKRLKLLQNGQSPETLQLGKECIQPTCQALLTQVYRLWCKGGTRDTASVVAGGTTWHLVSGIEAIHYYISGEIFRQPGDSVRLSRREANEIATFGRIATRDDNSHGRRQGFMLESWQMHAESPAELSLTRPIAQVGARLSLGQLVAIRPPDRPTFALGVLTWVATDDQRAILSAGVRILPGTPVAVALRGTGITALNETFRQGFRLPAVDRLGERKSLVMPTGLFRPGRIIEIHGDQTRRVRLARLLARGNNFERADFEWA